LKTMFVDAFYFPGHALPLGPALSGVTVKIADFWRFLFPLRRHPGWVGLARNAAGPELLSRQIVLGRILGDWSSRPEESHPRVLPRSSSLTLGDMIFLLGRNNAREGNRPRLARFRRRRMELLGHVSAEQETCDLLHPRSAASASQAEKRPWL
jgi:hypothetical protein